MMENLLKMYMTRNFLFLSGKDLLKLYNNFFAVFYFLSSNLRYFSFF